jgi:hypothetical protein
VLCHSIHEQSGVWGAFARLPDVTQAFEEFLKFVAATMQVTDDIERTGFGFSITPKRSSYDLCGFDLLWRIQHVNKANFFSFEFTEAFAHLFPLAQEHMTAEGSV